MQHHKQPNAIVPGQLGQLCAKLLLYYILKKLVPEFLILEISENKEL
jgi:hypothetical protein